jgi:hypothetical protein
MEFLVDQRSARAIARQKISSSTGALFSHRLGTHAGTLPFDATFQLSYFNALAQRCGSLHGTSFAKLPPRFPAMWQRAG